LHRLGHPAALKNAVSKRIIVPFPITPPVDTFWTRSVVRWDTWLDASSSSFSFKPYLIDYRVPEAENLICKETIENFHCDISLIKGISNSKAVDYDITDINDLSVRRRPDLVEPVTQEHLETNMDYGGLRLDRMRFAEYPWSERRYYWHNDDGSHHLSAARYQAGLLQQSVSLTGTLNRYIVNAQMATALRNKWHIFVIPKEELFGCFNDSMEAFECPFAWSALPENMHDPRTCGVELCIVWLERDNPKAGSVANVLATSGFPNFGEQLALLIKKTGDMNVQ